MEKPFFVFEVKEKTFSEWANNELDTILRMHIGQTQNDRIAQLQRDIDHHFEALGPLAREVPGFQVYFKVGAKGMLLGGARFPAGAIEPGDMVPCGSCGAMTPWDGPPYDPSEQLCAQCHKVAQELRENDDL